MSVETTSDLYGLPPEEFTAARNALANRLREDGDKAEAKRVRGLKKPSLPAWTVNQLARKHGGRIEELLRLRDEIEEASSAADLRSRTEERRKVLTQLVADAKKVLIQDGHAPSASTIEKVSQTLLAAGDDDTREQLVSGTLERELTATTGTFGAFGSFDAATVMFDDEPDQPDPRVERLKMEAEDAEQVAQELADAAEQAEAAADEARDRAAEAQRKAIKARQRAADAEKS
jgi:hypothetical protein